MGEHNTNSHQDNKTPSSSSSCLRFTRPTLRPTSGVATTTSDIIAAAPVTCQASHPSLTTSSSSSLVTPSTSDGSPSRRYSEVTLARHASSTATGSAASSSPQPLPMPHTTITTTSNISNAAISSSTEAVPTASPPPPHLSASVLSVEEYPRRECPKSHDNNNTTTKGTTEHTLLPSCSETVVADSDTRRRIAGAQLSCSTSLVPTPMSAHKTTHNITTSSHALFMQGQTSMCEEAGTHVCTGTDTDLASTGLYALSAHTSVETSSLPMTCHDERDGAASTTRVETSSTTTAVTTTAITQPIAITIVPTTITVMTSSHNNNNSSSTTSSGDAGGSVVHTAMMSTSNELTGHTAWMTRADDKPHTSYCSPSHHHNKDNKEEDVESAGCSPRSFLSRTVPAGGSSGDVMVPGHHASSSNSSGGRQVVHNEAEHDETNTPILTHCVTSSSAAAVNNDDDDDATRHAARVSHNIQAVQQAKHEESKACSEATDLQPSAACAEMTTSDSTAPLQQQQPAESATCVANGISSDRHTSSSSAVTTSAVSRLRRRAPALTIVTALPSDYTNNNNTPHDTPTTTMSSCSSSNTAMVVRASATPLPNTGSSTTAVAEGDEAVAQSQLWQGASCDEQQDNKEEEGRRAMMMGEREGGESSTLTPNATQQHHNNTSTSTSSHGTAHAMDAVPSSGLTTTTTTQPLSSASHVQLHYVTHHPSVNTIIIPAHNITTTSTTSNMGSAALPPLLLQTHTTTSSAQHAQTQRAALYAEREPSLSACGTPFTSSPAVLSCRSSTPHTTTSVTSSATNTTSMYSARSARYSHYRRGATLTTQGGTAATMLHGHHYCYYPTLTLREWFPQLPASLRLSRERVYVHRSRERQLGKGAYGVVMLGQLYPPRTRVQVERDAGWSGYDMSRCCGGDGAARTNANAAATIVVTAPVEGNNKDTGGGEAEKTKSAAEAGEGGGSDEVRSGTSDVTASSHTSHNTTTTSKTAVEVGDVMPMHQQPYSKYTVAFYDCGPQPFLTNFATRKTTIMSTTVDTSRRNHATAVHDVTSPSSSPQQQQQHEEAQALIASPPPPPSSSSLLRMSEGIVQGSSGSSRVSGRQAQLHRALTLSLPHSTHVIEEDSEKKEENVMGPTQPVTPTMTTPSATHDSVAALDSNNNNKQSVTVTEATTQQTISEQCTSPALPPCEERTTTHMETNTATTTTSDGVPHTTAVANTATSSSNNDETAVVVVGHETDRTKQYSSPAVPRMPLSVTTQRPLASPQLSSALSLDTTAPSLTPTTNNSSSSSSPLLWLPTTTTTGTNTRKSSAAAVLRASQLVRQSSPPLTFPALRRSPSLHGLTETTPPNTTTTSVGLMSTRPQTTTTSSSVAAVTMMPTRSSAATTTTTTHVPLVTSSTITTTTNSNSNAALVAASALRTQRSPAQPPSPLLPLRRALSVHYSPHTRRYATQGTSNNNNNDINDNDNDTSRHAYAQPRTGSPALSSSPSQLHLFTTLSPEQQTRHQSRRPPPASVEEHVLRATSTTTPGPPLCSSSSSSLLVKSSSAAVYRRTYDSQEDHRATSLTTAPRLHDTTLTQSFSSSSLQQQHERLQGTTTTTTTTAGNVGRLTPQLSPAKTPSPPSPPLSRLLRQQQVQRGRTRSNSRYATPLMLRDASAPRASPPPVSAATAPTPDKTTPTTTDDEPHRLLHPSNNNNNNTLVMTSSLAEAPQLQQERHTMAEEEEMTVKAPSTTTHDDIIIPTTTPHNMLTGDALIQGDLLSTRREATLYDTHSTTTTTTTHAASVWRRSTPLTAPSAFNNNKSYTSSFTQATNTVVIPDSAAVTPSGSRHVMSSSSRTHQLPYRAVAVKVIYKADLAKPVFAEAAHNEVVMASQLHHPCLVNFFGIAEDKDYLLFVMDLSEKGNLRQYLERYGPRHTRRMAPRFLADVVLALEYFRDAQQHPYEPSHNVDDTSSTTTVSRKTNYQHYRTSTMPTTTTTSTAPVTARASWESNVATSLRGTPVSCDEAQQHSAHTTNASTVATTTPVSGDGSHILQSGDTAAEELCTDSSAEVTPHTLSPTTAAGQHSHANETQHHTTLLHPISTSTTAQTDTVPEQTLTTTASHPPNPPMQQQHNYTSTSSFASSLQEMAQAERQSVLPPHPCSTTITSGSSNAEGLGEETESAVRHCRGIVLHRDLKPDNLTLTWDYHVKIGDFGSACFYEDDEGNRFAGSPAYISPEVILHDKAGPYSDLWAMGCILYELLEGRAAFAADTPFLLTQKIKHFEPDSLVFSSSTLFHHNNNNSNDEDEWFSEYDEEEEEQRMGHARDLVRQLLQPVPEARLGSRERGGFATLKAHPFFATIDWSHVLTTSNLAMSNTNYAHEIAEYLRANETLRYCSPVVRLEEQQCNASPSLQQQQQHEEEQQQHETASNGCHSGSNEASDEATKKKSSSTQVWARCYSSSLLPHVSFSLTHSPAPLPLLCRGVQR